MTITYTPTDVTLLLAAAVGSLSSLFLIIQRSSCYRIECCCMKCDREVRSLGELEEGNPATLETITHTQVEDALTATLTKVSPPGVVADRHTW